MPICLPLPSRDLSLHDTGLRGIESATVPIRIGPQLPAMKWWTLGAAAWLCVSSASCTPDAAQPPIHRRFDYDPFRARGLAPRQDDGQRCGAEYDGQVCPGQTCCSMYGYCGDGPEYCNRFSCQVDFGWCDGQPIPTSTPEPEPEPEPEPIETEEPTEGDPADPTTDPETGETSVPELPEFTISEDGLCGNVTTCVGSTFGRCCSDFYWCGDDDSYCGDGCRVEFGECGEAPEESEPEPEPEESAEPEPEESAEPEPEESAEPEPEESAEPEPEESAEPEPEESAEPEPEEPVEPPQAELVISSDGMCGNGTTCAGSDFGDCCSWYFYCGEGESYCGDQCRSAFGSCNEEEPAEPPQVELEISTNGMCGNGTTCAGSEYGGCCSWWFYCGSGAEYCTSDCRSEFGECETT